MEVPSGMLKKEMYANLKILKTKKKRSANQRCGTEYTSMWGYDIHLLRNTSS